MDNILSNQIYILLIAIVVMIIPFLICCFHYKKYGILQAIFSILTVPMIFHGIGELLQLIFKSNYDMVILIDSSISGLNSIFELHKGLYSLTGWQWLYNTGWIYMPSIVIFILSYGYSITIRKKLKHKKDKED